jgi:hypothetical protein
MRREVAGVALVLVAAAVGVLQTFEAVTTPPAPDPFALTGRWEADDGRVLHLWLQEIHIPGATPGGFEGGFTSSGLLRPGDVTGAWNFGSFHPTVINLPADQRPGFAQIQWVGPDTLLARFTDDATRAADAAFLTGPDAVRLTRDGGPDVRRLSDAH